MNKKDIKALIEDINVTLLPSGELLVDTKYANEAKSVRLMDREGFTRVFEEPKTGKWVEKDGMWCDDPTFRCSVCGEEYELLTGTPIDNGMNYCPNCGSRMFERRNDE